MAVYVFMTSKKYKIWSHVTENLKQNSLTIRENSLTFLKALKVNSTNKQNSVP